MKKISLLLLALLACLSLAARDFDAVCPSGQTLYYDMVQGGAMVVGWDYSNQDNGPIHLVIPSVVNNGGANLHVIAIGDNAFSIGRRMVSVTIPSSVKSIGASAFNRCFGLGSISIPSTVESIGTDAFAFIPNVEYAGPAEGAPWGALNLNAYHEGQYYYADETKTHIVCCERDATDATIPASVTSIGTNAFNYCYNITTLHIDSTVAMIGSDAFSDCVGLESLFYNPRLSGYDDNGFTFSDCTSLQSLTFGSTVDRIPFYSFAGCSSLREIVIPDNITNVGSYAFKDCTSLESAIVGKGLLQASSSMFEGCTSLAYVSFSDSLKNIGSYAFSGCQSLRFIVAGNLIENIGNEAFRGCRSLENIDFGKRLKFIGGKAFYGCSSLTEIVVPRSFISFGNEAFSGCTGVSRIVCMKDTIPVMATGVFDSIDPGIEVVVPCGMVDEYRQESHWQKFENIHGQQYFMVVTSNNPLWGKAVVTRQPTCDDNAAVIEAIPEEGCRFVKWSDNSRENPRQINYSGTGYAYRKAIFEKTVGIQGPKPVSDIKVYASHGNIVIEGARGEQLSLFDLMGRQLLTTRITTDVYIVPRAKSQKPTAIYLVKVGNRKADKVMVFN